MKGDIIFREASLPDSPAIAALHAASWRAHYRDAASEAYLDGPIEAERRTFWAARLATPDAGRIVVLAERAERLAGFACVLVDHDPRWGSLIDNLHVASHLKGGGIGRALMREAASRLPAGAAERPVHLFVLEANRDARRFYERMGGEPAGETWHPLPDGSNNLVLRYAWASPRHIIRLAEGLSP